MENTSSNKKSIIGFFAFLGVAAVAMALALTNKKDDEIQPVTLDENNASDTATIMSTSTVDASSTPSSTSTAALTAYKNGTYSATGSYKSPAGIEQINISVTIENDVITETTYKGLAENSRSIEFQEKFGNGYREAVIGRNISSLQLSKVSGSSLTPIGFNDALGKIRDEAARI